MSAKAERPTSDHVPALLDAARTGDRAAFTALITPWHREMVQLAHRMTGDEHDAHDITQLAIIRVHHGLAGFDGRSSFSTWLYRIVLNLCRDHARRSDARRRHEHGSHGRASSTQRIAHPHHDAPEHAERFDAIKRAVADLPHDQREVLVLRHYHERSLVEIAQMLELPPTTVRSRLARALELLRVALRDEGGGLPNHSREVEPMHREIGA